MEPHQLTASQAAALLAEGKLSCEELTRSCLQRIADRDGQIRAWAYIDADQAIRTAREIDKAPPKGVLHGLPVGFKDIIATADMPTTFNSELYQGHQLGQDASCVAIVRHSGGVVLGKTDTVEFASGGRTALTRNPVNPHHTPGGSSSGSAAAVADGHVPLAFGTQTGGSVIRPAAFTGIYAIKPSFGVASYEGVRNVSPSLDTVGWYARSIEDLQLVARAFRMHDMDDASVPRPEGLKIGLCRTPMWSRAEQDGRLALETAGRRLASAGCEVFDLVLPVPFEGMSDAAACIGKEEKRAIFLAESLRSGPRLSRYFHGMAEAAAVAPRVLAAAHDLAAHCRTAFDGLFAAGKLDAVIAPAAPGEAPEGLHSTGDAVFNTMWTLLHAPCISIPVGSGSRGLPLAVQLIGPRFEDGRMLRLAKALAPFVDVKGPIAH